MQLEKTLPDNDLNGNLDDCQGVLKLNDYFVPKRNKQYVQYIFLKSRHEAGETTVAYATRLREKCHWSYFFLSFIFYYFHTTCNDQYKHKLLYIALVRKAFTCLNNHS